ncbi:MAG: hypothetical protein KAG18_06075 [Sinobacterium sp.]|nr:hypothetical protein [Sinobacterium sp.]
MIKKLSIILLATVFMAACLDKGAKTPEKEMTRFTPESLTPVVASDIEGAWVLMSSDFEQKKLGEQDAIVHELSGHYRAVCFIAPNELSEDKISCVSPVSQILLDSNYTFDGSNLVAEDDAFSIVITDNNTGVGSLNSSIVSEFGATTTTTNASIHMVKVANLPASFDPSGLSPFSTDFGSMVLTANDVTNTQREESDTIMAFEEISGSMTLEGATDDNFSSLAAIGSNLVVRSMFVHYSQLSAYLLDQTIAFTATNYDGAISTAADNTVTLSASGTTDEDFDENGSVIERTPFSLTVTISQ